MAALENRQKPIGRSDSAWWPGGRTWQKALAARPLITASTACRPAPTARSAASQDPAETTVSPSMWRGCSSGPEATLRIFSKYVPGCARRIASSASSRSGASSRDRLLNTSWASTLSIARMRSGRSGWPGPVSWSTNEGCVRSSVAMSERADL